MLGLLVEPVIDGRAAVSYGRQVPRPGASDFEGLPLELNFPGSSHVRNGVDGPQFGVSRFECSNAFAAWSTRALDEIGGFPATLSHEDAAAAAALLLIGHQIAYVADAVVEHSHPYGLRGDLARHFDAGFVHEHFAQLLHETPAEQRLRGVYARMLLWRVARSSPWQMPYAVLHLAVKWVGFQIGVRHRRAPRWLKRTISGQEYYWHRKTGSQTP